MEIREQITLLPRKYQIGKRPLSRILGWGELTYTRIIDGARPTPQHEAELLRALNEPFTYIMLLDQAYDAGLVSETSYRRSRKAAEEYMKEDAAADSALKLHAVATRFCVLAQGDVTPHALQLLVYYAHGASFAALKKPLIDQQPIAADDGPKYPGIDTWFTFDRIQEIGKAADKSADEQVTETPEATGKEEKADKSGKNGKIAKDDAAAKSDEESAQGQKAEEAKQTALSAKETALIDNVFKKYGMYSGTALGDMARGEAPWKKTRKRAAKEGVPESEAEISAKAMAKFFSKK